LKLAIVDYDGTLFQKETIPFLIKIAKKGRVPKKDYYKALVHIYLVVIRYKSGLDKSFDKERFHREAAKAFLKIFNNCSNNEIERFFSNALIEAKDLFNKNILKEIDQLKSKGYYLVLLSGGFFPYMELVGKLLNFDKVFATELEYLEKGFNLKKELKFITGENKKEIILQNFSENNVDWASSYAYADSYFDSEVLELTGNPHAVNPDETLKKYAEERNWPVIGLS
jgi:HAD superfamily phosphoserine phosphatase-like hydrolase